MLKFCLKATGHSNESLCADIEGAPIYQCKNYNFIREGYAFSLSATIAENGDRFLIDFNTNNANKDIALRLALRASTNSLGRTSRRDHRWGREETKLENPLRLVKSKKFTIEVLFTYEYIYIAFDGIHVAKYSRRICYAGVQIIEIRGNVVDLQTDHNFISNYPSQIRNTFSLHGRYVNSANTGGIELAAENEDSDQLSVAEKQVLPLPYYATFSQGFIRQDYSIIVTGRVSDNPKMIKIVLQEGQNVWPSPVIAIQLSLRFFQKRHDQTYGAIMAFDSFANIEWTGEVIVAAPTGLRPGADFNLRIVRGITSFQIYSYDKHINSYRYFVSPGLVDTCCVQGDIELMDVVIESD